ncbi:hypothetical protein F4802DRAFT_442822 [Xylaria palmicola]|nr:hypothetical protein F4802DRAFT_442822 [Xylaria palmicola]
MSRLSPPSNLHRSRSPVSVAASDTTYHSFYDVELFEPASPVATLRIPPKKADQFGSKPNPIVRQDSGYESTCSAASHRHNPAMSKHSPSRTQHQKRPGLEPRVVKSASALHPHPRRLSGHALHMTMSQQHQQPQSSSYYCFPSPEGISSYEEAEEQTGQVHHPPPPQTTHYWTSDHTRRLEYAAIDAASRGVKGWVMKHVVPDCFVPKESRRVTFDDDTGSVRRYRLELECDDSSLKDEKRSKKLGWLFGR